jgi:CRP-like cAMP-binding protein
MTQPSNPNGAARFLVEFEAGESIFQQGDLGREMFIVHEGEVEIVQERPGRTDYLAKLEKGDFFGEMSLLEDLPRLATARAVTAVKLVKVDDQAFDNILRKDPEIAIRIMRKLSHRLREIDEQLFAPQPGEAQDAADPAVEEQAELPVVTRARAESSLCLMHEESRASFPLSVSGETVIGRHDPVTGLRPGIDLSPIDPDRSSSRSHAKIYFQEGAFHLVEEVGTTNGTFVNGSRLEAGRPLRVAAGDQLRLGLVELLLTDESGR